MLVSGYSRCSALVAQGIEHRFPKPGVASSNLAEGAVCTSCSLNSAAIDPSAPLDPSPCSQEGCDPHPQGGGTRVQSLPGWWQTGGLGSG